MVFCFGFLILCFMYSNTEPEADKVATLNRLHGLLLHLLIMLSNEIEKKSDPVSKNFLVCSLEECSL